MILSYHGHTPRLEDASFVAENAAVIGDVSVGKNVNIWYGAVIRGDEGHIEIGEGTNVQDNVTLHLTPGYPLTVGKGVSIGHNAVVHGATVGDHVLIGMQACVLNGAVIGDHSIVAAGALVKEREVIPPYSLCVGVPARVVRTLSPEQAKAITENAETYMKLAEEYAAERK